MKKQLSKTIKSKWFFAGAGLILGALLILGIRFISYQPEEGTHYHANLAVYINGQREQFANPIYYTEVEESCAAQGSVTPHERAHMHDNVNDAVHIEDEAVTWGHFFQNIGWAVDAKFIKTHDQLLLADEQNKVTFILNGKPTDGINRLVVGNEDKLLVSYGTASGSDLDKYYQSIASTARKYNQTPDPASCGASHTEPSFRDRLNHLL